MRNFLLGLSLAAVLGLVSCAFLEEQKANVQACLADPVCLAKARSTQATVETASVIGASALPFPGAAAAPKVLGFISFGIALLLGGRALRKRDPN